MRLIDFELTEFILINILSKPGEITIVNENIFYEFHFLGVVFLSAWVWLSSLSAIIIEIGFSFRLFAYGYFLNSAFKGRTKRCMAIYL